MPQIDPNLINVMKLQMMAESANPPKPIMGLGMMPAGV